MRNELPIKRKEVEALPAKYKFTQAYMADEDAYALFIMELFNLLKKYQKKPIVSGVAKELREPHWVIESYCLQV